jgi:outer membrane protein TolC
LIQSIYEGGRIQSSIRSARLLREQAMLDYQTVIADTMLLIRVAYDDALQATNEIVVRESSVALLMKELEDTKHRFDAGVVPQFNVLRAEVEVANARPKLIRARNNYRIAKQRLVNELGINLPRSVLEDVPLQLADKLGAEPYSIDLSDALDQALEHRTELASPAKRGARKEGVRTAKSGYKPTSSFSSARPSATRARSCSTPASTVYGWAAGARMT